MASSPEEYEKLFDAREYLLTRYQKVRETFHGTTLRGLHELYSGGASGLKILEIGCGPVIAYQISAAPFASGIVMADLVQSNRDAVQLWLDKSHNAHDWTPFFRHVVQTLKGAEEEEEIARREEQLRKVVKVIYCNALEDPPVPAAYEGPYDVILTPLILSVLSKTKHELTACLSRLAKLLKPGGRFVSKTLLMEGSSATTHKYCTGEGWTFVDLNISEEMFRAALTQTGFSDINIVKSPVLVERMKELQLEDPGLTYVGMAYVSAIKA